MFQILANFRRIAEALESVNYTLGLCIAAMREARPADERLEALELSRAQFEADVEGVLMKAQGKLKAAANAEARERTMKKAYEDRIDDFDSNSVHTLSEEEVADIRRRDAQGSQEEQVHPVHLDVAPVDKKAYALRAKFLG